MRFPYDTHRYHPPAPHLAIRLGLPDESLAVGPLQAFVDTGADASLVPLRYIDQLGAEAENQRNLRSQWGERRQVDIYVLDIAIGGVRLPSITVVGDDISDEIILGRDVLNKLIVTLNGPEQFLEVNV